MIADRTLTVSLLPTAKTSQATRAPLTALELCAALTRYDVRAEKDGPAWSPILWRGDRRAASGAESVCALVYDLDHAEPHELDALDAALDRAGCLYALHETYTAGRVRLVLPLSRDLSPAEYPREWQAARVALGIPGVDESGADLARLFYLPTCPVGEERAAVTGGSSLYQPQGAAPEKREVSQPIESAPRENPPAEHSAKNFCPIDLEPIRAAVSTLPTTRRRLLLDALSYRLTLRKGERENQLHALVSSLTDKLPPQYAATETQAWNVIREIFGAVVARMEEVEDEGEDYYMAKVRSSFERSYAYRQQKEARARQAEEFFRPDPNSPDAWRSKLLTNPTKEGTPASIAQCTANVDTILEHHPDFAGFIRFNGLSRRVEVTGGVLAVHSRETMAQNLSYWLQRSEFQLKVSAMDCGAALLAVAKRHEYNPVSDYLHGLRWDGVPRVAQVLTRWCEAVGNKEFIEDITRKFFVSAAARALEPGCKVDTVLVLQGTQGTGKTSFVEVLAGDWYTTVHSKIDDKDTRMQATGAWFVELSELATAARSTIEQLRGFLTQRSDDIRVPYAATIENYPRRCVFVGTTNSDQPLIDQDGNRRYWVVACGRINIPEIQANRDQLWAEAVELYREHQQQMQEGRYEEELTARWWLTPAEQKRADAENGVFLAEDPFDDAIKAWLAKPGEKPEWVTVNHLAQVALHMTAESLVRDHTILSRLGKTMKALNWERQRRGNDTRGRYWAYRVPKRVDEGGPT